ncbi:MAG: kinase [Clostridiales bacterium]|jgi:NAD+ kinase|nr:kinase [Clostridiales bacterium]MDK2933373.1 kinase [Clostridiales bacterium]
MKKILIIPNIDKDKELQNTKKVIDLVKKFNKEVLISEQVAKMIKTDNDGRKLSELYSEADLVIVLGGDGTLLNVARHTAPYNIPLLGINLGHLGFLVELEKNNLGKFFDKLFAGDYTIDYRMMIEGTLLRGSMTLDTFIALNDIGITRGAFSRIIDLKIFVNEQFVDFYPADGIVISTPTGSTAYSLSAGGPIVDPNMGLIMITPICPHTLHSRSIIVPDNKVISVHLIDAHYHDAMITVDGQKGYKLQPKDIITIKRASYVIPLIRINNRSFYDVLRKKLTERGIKSR